MATWPNPAIPLLLVAALLAFEDWLSTPSCSRGPPAAHGSGDLRAMMVADLMLLGSDASFVDRHFRDHVMPKFFANSIQRLKPDMIIVLGDISARGLESTEAKWISVIQQFEGILGPYSTLPLHIVLGDKDVGTCANLEGKFVRRWAKHLPMSDSSGCGSFGVSNVSFVSLNAVALLCSDNALRFGIEKVMERENHHIQRERVYEAECDPLRCERSENFSDISWRQNNMESGSGPVVLLHFPLYKFDREGEVTGVPTISEEVVSDHSLTDSSSKLSGANDKRLYDHLHTLPANSTQYVLQALKPRIIFNAHSGSFSVFIHADGTYEVTVLAMTWKTRGVPGFVIATFDTKGSVTLRCCWLAREWHVIMASMSDGVALFTAGYIGEFDLLMITSQLRYIVVEFNGRLNKCGVISTCFDVKVKETDSWTVGLLPSRQFVYIVLPSLIAPSLIASWTKR